MIITLFSIILLVSAFLYVLLCGCKKGILHDFRNFSKSIMSISAFFLMISLVILPINHMNTNKSIEKEKTRYETLINRMENKEEAAEGDIEEWNQYITEMQYWQDNEWVGIFIVDIYNQFKPIN